MHPFTSYIAAKHPKRSKFAITDTREKLVDFFCCTTWASTLSSARIIGNLGTFAKCFCPCSAYNSLEETQYCLLSYPLSVYLNN